MFLQLLNLKLLAQAFILGRLEMILEFGTAVLRAIQFDLQLIDLLSQHIHLFIGLLELALHHHLLSLRLLYVVAHLLVHVLELFDALDYKEL